MLSLVESENHLWERFLDGSVDPARVAADPLLRHWQRARALGVSAEGPATPEGIGYDELLDRREREGQLVHASGEVLRGLEAELARRGVIAILADRDGIVLHAVGGGRFLGSAARSRLVEGACWAEGSRGTNAIGTALSDERSVHVRGRAHFERMNHALFCYAAPVHDRLGRVVAVLDLTGGIGDENPELGRLLRHAVHDVERRLARLAVPTLSAVPRASRPASALLALPAPSPFDSIWGDDPALGLAKQKAALFAASELAVLLLGETGTGKELFAKAVHAASAHAQGPFVAVNCGALSSSLLASELFGHAPSAFTGASRSGQAGKLEAAHGGTLFLDEVAELDATAQAALLRVLEDGSFYRLGEHKPRQAQFRLICATCNDLRTAVAEGRFRRDLFFRLSAAPLTLPSLRDRADRLALAQHLARPHRLGADAARHVLAHEWSGNVRELKNALAHAALLAGGETLARQHFPEPFPLERVPSQPPSQPTVAAPVETRRDDILLGATREALRASGGNVSKAAKQLGVARSTVYRILRRGD